MLGFAQRRNGEESARWGPFGGTSESHNPVRPERGPPRVAASGASLEACTTYETPDARARHPAALTTAQAGPIGTANLPD